MLSMNSLASYDRHRRSMFTAYALWFVVGGFGAHLIYARRWAMLAVHYVAAAVLSYSFYVSSTGAYQDAHDNTVFAWFAIMILEGAILWHQVQDTNARWIAKRCW